jgi:hypothetical protein
MNQYATWLEDETNRRALWSPPNTAPVPKRIAVVDDTLTGDDAFRLASQGTALLWRGDYHNARQLLAALAHRVGRKKSAGKKRRAGSGGRHDDQHGSQHGEQHEGRHDGQAADASPRDAFNRYRMAQSQRAQLLNRVLVRVDRHFALALRRAPDVGAACDSALGPIDEPFLVPLRALLGFIGAYEWQRKGVAVPLLPKPIHVPYGVFSPIRGEYLDLVGQAPLPRTQLAFDIGTGSGVIAAMLAQRGIGRIIATDCAPRALACARRNMENLGLSDRVELINTHLFPQGQSDLIVCNPPWIPARPTTQMEAAIYDPDSRMLVGFLNGLREHLSAAGEAWLILSDLAVHLGLRDPDFLPAAMERAGLDVAGRLDTKPRHPKATGTHDPLHKARGKETTTLWRLTLKR